jgi:hypothetical protein
MVLLLQADLKCFVVSFIFISQHSCISIPLASSSLDFAQKVEIRPTSFFAYFSGVPRPAVPELLHRPQELADGVGRAVPQLRLLRLLALEEFRSASRI